MKSLKFALKGEKDPERRLRLSPELRSKPFGVYKDARGLYIFISPLDVTTKEYKIIKSKVDEVKLWD